ncbi:MAG: hypothetical protein K5739_06240 [Lachnospiraceae bacterium]|nr:hypothetical protein [Lachnospiraceae bacterium]
MQLGNQILFEKNSIGAQIGSGMWYFCCILALVLLCVQVAFFAGIMLGSERRKDRILVGSELTVVFFLLNLLNYGFYYGKKDWSLQTNGFITELYRQPAALFFMLEIMLSILDIMILISHYRRSKEVLSRHAVMEAINSIHAGVCIAREDGTVLMTNAKMNELSLRATGDTLFHTGALLEKLEEKGGRQEGEEEVLFSLDTDEVWQFHRQKIRANDRNLWQLTASDMTKEQRQARRMEEQNRHLSRVREMLKTVSATERDMVALREVDRAKITVHNQMGNVLLVGKYYLDHPENMDEKELLGLLSFNNKNLTRWEEREKEKTDPVKEAVQMAERIGLKVYESGEKNVDPDCRKVIGEAVRQCATNAVRHGEASELYIKTVLKEGGRVVEISNNGKVPKKPVRMGGGLGALEKEILAAGGRLTIEREPAFLLRILLPKNRTHQATGTE